MIDVSVIIVNYNTKDWLKRYIESIDRETNTISCEIIVIDNNSTDGSADMVRDTFPFVKLIANQENLYTTRGFNQGIAIASGRNIFISDADLELKDNVLERMVTFLDKHPNIGIVGCRFENTDGTVQAGYSRDFTFLFSLLNFTFLGKIFKNKSERLNEEFTYSYWDRTNSMYIDVCDTAFMMKKSLVCQLQYYHRDPYTRQASPIYDEGLTLYCHNQLLCYKARQLNWKVYFLGDTYIVHGNHSSVNKENWLKISKIYRKDLHYLFTQLFGTVPAWIIRILMGITGICLYAAWSLGWYEPKKSIAYGLS